MFHFDQIDYEKRNTKDKIRNINFAFEIGSFKIT